MHRIKPMDLALSRRLLAERFSAAVFCIGSERCQRKAKRWVSKAPAMRRSQAHRGGRRLPEDSRLPDDKRETSSDPCSPRHGTRSVATHLLGASPVAAVRHSYRSTRPRPWSRRNRWRRCGAPAHRVPHRVDSAAVLPLITRGGSAAADSGVTPGNSRRGAVGRALAAVCDGSVGVHCV